MNNDLIEQAKNDLPDWRLIVVDTVPRLERQFAFKNFLQALAFTNQVAEIAEAANHHPAILTEWGSVKVSWWSHDVKGLSERDLQLAEQTDALFN